MAAITILIEIEAPDQMLAKDLRELASVAVTKSFARKGILTRTIELYRTKPFKFYLDLARKA